MGYRRQINVLKQLDPETPDPDVPMPPLDPRTRQARLHDIYARMIKVSGQRPGVIIVEDVHWLDEASREALSWKPFLDRAKSS